MMILAGVAIYFIKLSSDILRVSKWTALRSGLNQSNNLAKKQAFVD